MNKILNITIIGHIIIVAITAYRNMTELAIGFGVAAIGWAYNKEKLLEQQKGE